MHPFVTHCIWIWCWKYCLHPEKHIIKSYDTTYGNKKIIWHHQHTTYSLWTKWFLRSSVTDWCHSLVPCTCVAVTCPGCNPTGNCKPASWLSVDPNCNIVSHPELLHTKLTMWIKFYFKQINWKTKNVKKYTTAKNVHRYSCHFTINC